MGKRIFSIVPVAAALMAIAIAGGYSINKADEKPQGCQSCHMLSEKLPEEHPFTAMLEEVKYCLVCHSVEGPAIAFDWIIHLNHYSSEEFEGDCWSCHMIDEKGNYSLYGADKEGIEVVNKEEVDSMIPYYESWATSDYEDHIHAQAGVTCTICHASFFPKGRKFMEQCQECHGYAYINPEVHFKHVPLWTTCSDCHFAHDALVSRCIGCH